MNANEINKTLAKMVDLFPSPEQTAGQIDEWRMLFSREEYATAAQALSNCRRESMYGLDFPKFIAACKAIKQVGKVGLRGQEEFCDFVRRKCPDLTTADDLYIVLWWYAGVWQRIMRKMHHIERDDRLRDPIDRYRCQIHHDCAARLAGIGLCVGEDAHAISNTIFAPPESFDSETTMAREVLRGKAGIA